VLRNWLDVLHLKEGQAQSGISHARAKLNLSRSHIDPLNPTSTAPQLRRTPASKGHEWDHEQTITAFERARKVLLLRPPGWSDLTDWNVGYVRGRGRGR